MTHPGHQKDTGLSRQARKTIKAIQTEESVPSKSIQRVLECLGFKKKQTGTHQTWRHPKGYRTTIVYRNHDEGIWGYQLKQIRDLLNEIEAKEGLFEAPETLIRDEELRMAHQFEKVKEKPTSTDIINWQDERVLQEKALPDLTKLDLTKLNEKNMIRAMSDSHVEMISYLKRLGSMVQSTQDYLIELSVKIDDFKTLNSQTASVPKLTAEEIKAKKEANLGKGRAARELKIVQKVKAAQAAHPQFAKNAAVLAGLSGVGVKTIEKYIVQGLV
jgi:predicted RNA binding protein YcfA (HicA-like mRNA interferase family)